MRDVDPPVEAEAGAADELDAVVERVEPGGDLRPLGQAADREERAGDEEHRRDQRAGHVGEVVDRLHQRGDQRAGRGPAEAGDEADAGYEQHPPRGVEPEQHRDEQRRAPVDPGAGRDPQRLRGDELLHVDRRGEDRVVGALELALDEGAEHRREHGREQHRGGDGPRADELDVVVAGHRRDQRAEAEAEREQVDRRLDGRGERDRPPVGRVVDDLAHEHARERGALEPAEPAAAAQRFGDRGHQEISSPVSRTKTSSRFAGRRSPSGGPPLVASSRRRIATEVPVRRVLIPPARATDSTSRSLAGGP